MVSEIGDVQNYLSLHPLFLGLKPTLLEDASKNILVAFEKAGAKLEIDRDTLGLIIIKTGSIELRTQNLLHDKLSAGDFLVCSELQDEGISEVRVLEDSLYYELTTSAFVRLKQNSPEFSQRCKHQLVEQADLKNTLAASAAKQEPQNQEYLLHRYVKDHMSKNVVMVKPTTSIREAAQLMRDHNITSLLVMENDSLVGIVTDRDFRIRVLAEGKSVDDTLQDVMTQNPICIEKNALLYEAQTKMMTTGIHHLPVVEQSNTVGIITVSDIFRIHNVEPLTLNKSIIAAQSLESLQQISEKIPELMVKLAERDTRPSEIGEIITLLYDGITKRLIKLAQQKFGPAPCAFSWLAFGSQARKEQVMGSDQDNALLLASNVTEKEKAFFASLSQFVCDGLNTCGIPYCSGEIMAMNERWCQPLTIWQEYFAKWIDERSPKALMHASIFFDMRHLTGDASLTQSLHNFVLERAKSNTIFLALMCENSMTHSPPLGFFKNFVLENDGGHINTLDLKKRGTIPIVDIARNYSLSAGITSVNTIERLKELQKKGVMSKEFSSSLIDAHEFIAGLRIESQARKHKNGEAITNHLDPTSLSPLLRRQLKDAFKFVKQSQVSMKSKFGGGYL